ncbi:hypothetical protein HCN44_007971 [Aphidius gifuensis]|uniref:Uncharacterized protein n=1 Tax=Aphidius gifuensis TaxID=684658 RepID=A0A835CMH8_APHGI|nr:hypothetical protein HCN44_007971 [Aphidius gifuensis]
MSGIIAKIIGLRLVGTTKYITKQNTKKYLQSMCHVRNKCSHITKNPITPAKKRSAGYWKTIKIYSVPFIVMNIAIYWAYIIKPNPSYWEDLRMWFAAMNETLKYSIIPSKIITSGVLFDDSEIKIESGEDNLTLVNDNTRNLILSKELDENIEKPFPRGEPMPIKIGNFNGLLDNGKLTLTTEDGDTTYTFHHTLSLKVKKSSTTLQNKIDAIKKNQRETIPTKIGKFNVLMPGSKLTLKTPESEITWTGIVLDPDIEGYNLENYTRSDSVSSSDKFPVMGNFNYLSHTKVKIQADDSDEVYSFNQRLSIECDKKLEKIAIKLALFEQINATFDTGTVVFKTQDGEKM